MRLKLLSLLLVVCCLGCNNKPVKSNKETVVSDIEEGVQKD